MKSTVPLIFLLFFLSCKLKKESRKININEDGMNSDIKKGQVKN